MASSELRSVNLSVKRACGAAHDCQLVAGNEERADDLGAEVGFAREDRLILDALTSANGATTIVLRSGQYAVESVTFAAVPLSHAQ